MKLICTVGTRPEAIKMAPVIMQLRQQADRIETVICVTGQHREMLDPILNLFQIVPHYDLNVMQPGQELSGLTAALLNQLDHVLSQEKPDWVLAQGDTTSVVASALSAYYHRVRFGHIEAGLRTRDKYHPYPEEMNRRITSVLSDLHFAPTERAQQNLLLEGIAAESIRVTGNTVIDALLTIARRPYTWESGDLASIPRVGRLILVTAHRRENLGRPLQDICFALKEIVTSYSDVQIVLPVHHNPQVKQTVHQYLAGIPRIHLLDSLDYLAFVHLMKDSYLILTDSGGLQEEAPTLGVPVLVLREVTERPEAVAAGSAYLVGTQKERIVMATAYLLDDYEAHRRMATASSPFGDGHASERIVNSLLETVGT